MFSSLLLAAVIISATPQEHQVENVINPKTVDLTVLERGPGHASMKLVPTDGGADGSRLVTLIVPNNDDGRVKLSNTIKTRDRMKPLVLGPNRKFLVYTIPFEDLQDAAKLKELAKENKSVQMYPMFRTVVGDTLVPVLVPINGKVIVNVKLLEKQSLKNFVDSHKLGLEAHVENNIFGTYLLNVTDESDLLDVFAVMEALVKENWVQVTRLDVTLLPLR
jgi:hypothetical protein